MYNQEMLKELGITRFRKSGLARSKDLVNILFWEKKNSKSSWLTSCHANGCGRTVEFRKKEGRYLYICTVCGNTSYVEEMNGRAILGF